MDIRVVLADDHAVLREGVRMVLEAQPGITVVGEAEDGRQALELVERLDPDVAVMDIAMPNLTGPEATCQIRRRFPRTQVVILTMHESQHYLMQIIKVGAVGCVLKRAAGTELVAAVRAAVRGESYFSPAIASLLLDDYRARLRHQDADEWSGLTDREREVLQLVAEGHTSQEIADLLTLSIKTIQTHRAHLMEKLDAHDRTDLVKYAIRVGAITAE
jgi:two-component system response regulator NreC